MALTREVHAREVLVERDRDERVGLVVAQANVEAGAVLLDEALLRQQRLGLGADDDELDLLDGGDHLRVAGTAGNLRLGEVGGDALADRLRLADVHHAAFAVAEQVHPRLVGEPAALRGERSRLARSARASSLRDRDGEPVRVCSARPACSATARGQ